MWQRMLAAILGLLLPLSALAEESLDDTLSAIFKRYSTTGGSIAVAKQGQLVYHFDYGMADKQQKIPVTAQTYFKSASVTKMVTGMRVMQLVEDGIVDLDEPLGTYLGYPVEHPKHKQAVTLRMLMTHTSGLSNTVPTGQTLQTLLSRRESWTNSAPGNKYRYSNFAGILGSVIEAASGNDLNTEVTQHIFAPLGLDAAYRVPLLNTPDSAALRYNGKGKLTRNRDFYLSEAWSGEADPEHHYDVGIGDLWIRADDLCRLGMALCGDGNLEGTILLTDVTVAEMMASQQGVGGITADSSYGLCVHRIDTLLPDRMVYGHQGMSESVLCNLYWEPRSGLVFALMTNGCDIRLDHYIAAQTREAFAAIWAAYGD